MLGMGFIRKIDKKRESGTLTPTLCKNAGSVNKLDGAKPPNRNLVVEVLAVAAVTSLSAPMKGTFYQGEPVFFE